MLSRKCPMKNIIPHYEPDWKYKFENFVVGKTNDERFYYDDLGFKALETKFVRGYSMIFIVPIIIAILVYVLQKVL